MLRVTLIATTCAVGLAVGTTRALAVQLEVPLHLDYLLLDAAVKQRLYTGPGGRAQLWSDQGNCGHLYATDPHFSRSGANVQLTTQGDLRAAITLAGQCLSAMSWNGNLIAIAKPRIADFALKLQITDLNFYDVDGTAIGGEAFGLVKNLLVNELGSFSYDLHPYLRQLQELAEELPPAPVTTEVKTALASLRAAPEVVAQDDGTEVALQMDVPASLLSPCAAPLTAQQKASWRRAAENLSNLLNTMATQTQAFMPDAQVRDEVARVAADSRTRVDSMADAPPVGGDPIPLFSDDWRRLRTALESAARRGSLRDQTAAVLAAITAVDVIFELDRRAPGLGCQLSQAGLRQLAARVER